VDNIISLWQIGITALVAGILIGALAYRLFAPSVKAADKVKTELDQARAELDNYKTSVNSHFDKTSELVSDLTQDFVKVYQHLAEGAQSLGDSSTLTNLLEQHQGKVLISVEDSPEEEALAADEEATIIVDRQDDPVESVDEKVAPEENEVVSEADAKPEAEDLASGSDTVDGEKKAEPKPNVH
jgi:uncharacterized membrane-anchored protein YhcB (DUF1043 family)